MLDVALVAAWLRSGNDALLAVKDPVTIHTCQHLAMYPDSRVALRFLWLLCGVAPEVEGARAGRRQLYGWLPTAALGQIELPGDYDWTEVAGQQRVRWSLLLNKDTSALSGHQAKTTLHDFAIFLHHGALNDDEIERIRSEIAARRGLRAVVVPVERAIPIAEARRRVLSATLACQRRNIDIYLSRSVNGHAFFGRERELAAIQASLARGSAVAITGSRKVGKSSLAAQYAHVFAGAPTGVLDFQKEGAPYDTESLAASIAKRLGIAGRTFADMGDFLKQRSGEPPFLVIDEFAVPFEHARRNPKAADAALAMAGFLRCAVDDGLLRLIVCNPLRSLYRQPYVDTARGRFDNPLLGRFEVIPLRGLERSATEGLLQFYSRRCLVTLQAEAVDVAVNECGGFPLLVRALLHRATNFRERPLVLTPADMREGLARDTAVDSPWEIVRSMLWRWGIEWARDHLERAANHRPVPEDDTADDLRLFGLLDSSGQLAFSVLRAVAARHSQDLDAGVQS